MAIPNGLPPTQVLTSPPTPSPPDPALPASAADSPLLTAARSLRELAGRFAAGADADQRLAPEVADALVEAGFAARFVPRRWGGTAVGFGELTRAVAEVGAGCPSAAWVGSLWAYTARFAAYLDPEGQAEVWAKGPDTRVVSALAPSGTARPVDGGWQVSGTWPYTSGIEFSDWALVVGPSPAEGGREIRFFAVPRGTYRIQETWSTVGMHATGSHSLLLDEVFVPERRTFLRDDMIEGRGASSDEPCHAVPLRAVNGLTFAAPILGAVRGALAAVETMLSGDDRPRRPGGDTDARLAYARAAARTDAAELLLLSVADSADQGRIDPETVFRGSRDSAFAVELLTDAVEDLFRAGGTRGQAAAHPLQRLWRDVRTASTHVALSFAPAGLGYAKERLGG
ncbi:actinorhodin polyketide dimerase ActVA [Streptomyces lacrimifluminis]|uniref:Hydrolase n=1 Tax=Streptomyces lacrimifluminis TaxID=1500077 RepID=A0A917KJG6_9ACTN|nr:acyl-CoA dehydrogenase family protein [Streptomyces lacrimifluminis]GGJ14730.1 hydrolase [Streptomyces lacrimifluminis]